MNGSGITKCLMENQRTSLHLMEKLETRLVVLCVGSAVYRAMQTLKSLIQGYLGKVPSWTDAGFLSSCWWERLPVACCTLLVFPELYPVFPSTKMHVCIVEVKCSRVQHKIPIR